MGSTQGSRPEWEKPEIVELGEAEDAAGLPPFCTPGSAAFDICGTGAGVTPV
jgi:hypothetical protein